MDEFLVSEHAAVVPPAITNNSRSRYVVIWGVQNGANLVGALFDLQGHPVSGEFAVSQSAGSACALPVATHMAGPVPGFAVAWAQGSPPRIMFRRFGPDGAAIGAPLQVDDGAALAGFAPAIARGSDANSIVCWIGEDTAVHAVAFDESGRARGPAFEVSPAGGFHTGPVRAVGLENNSFAVCWAGGDRPGSGNVMLQVLQTNGQKVGGARNLQISRFGNNFAIAPLVNSMPGAEPGHFALAHVTSQLDGQQRLVIGTIFGPSGDRLGSGSFNITQEGRNTIASNPAMAAMPGRRVLVTWSERAVPELHDATGENVKAIVLHEDRGPQPGAADVDLGGLVPALDVHPVLEGDQSLPSAAFAIDFDTGEGTSAIVWLDDNVGGSDASIRFVKGRVFQGSDLPA